jgi:hypothetical protein
MVRPHDRLRISEEDVAAKIMDGEAIIINLTNGLYYSMGNVGGVIWSLIEERRSLEDIAATIGNLYDVSPAQAQTDVHRLAEELLQEGLVAMDQDAAPPQASAAGAPREKRPYEPPQLETYRDMANLFALDPPMPGLRDLPWKEPRPRPEDG